MKANTKIFLLLFFLIPITTHEEGYLGEIDMTQRYESSVVGEIVWDGRIMEVVKTTKTYYHYRAKSKK